LTWRPNDGSRGPVHKTIDEWSVGILENLLDRAGKLVGGLGPIMVFHGDHENRFDFFRAGGQVAHREQQGKYAQHAETSDVRH
jgi:hypothetical protein